MMAELGKCSAVVRGYFLAMLPLFASLYPGFVRADELAQIVTTCHFANAEWGQEMIERCVTENRSLRDAVLALPDRHADAIARCRENAQLGWGWVKACVEKDAQAQDALLAYPTDASALISACQRELGTKSFVAIKNCVDTVMKGSDRR